MSEELKYLTDGERDLLEWAREYCSYRCCQYMPSIMESLNAARKELAEHCCDGAYQKQAMESFLIALGCEKTQTDKNEWMWKNTRAEKAEAELASKDREIGEAQAWGEALASGREESRSQEHRQDYKDAVERSAVKYYKQRAEKAEVELAAEKRSSADVDEELSKMRDRCFKGEAKLATALELIKGDPIVDRAWKDESLIMSIAIVLNAVYWAKERVKKLEADLAELKSAERWIPVSEEGTPTEKPFEAKVDPFAPHNPFTCAISKLVWLTHWRPLPAPPEKKEKI